MPIFLILFSFKYYYSFYIRVIIIISLLEQWRLECLSLICCSFCFGEVALIIMMITLDAERKWLMEEKLITTLLVKSASFCFSIRLRIPRRNADSSTFLFRAYHLTLMFSTFFNKIISTSSLIIYLNSFIRNIRFINTI